jgi:hypothetical protein
LLQVPPATGRPFNSYIGPEFNSGALSGWRVGINLDGNRINAIQGFEQNGVAIGMNCGTSSQCSNTPQPMVRRVYGSVRLSGGTTTVSGISPPFSSRDATVCYATDRSTASAAAINLISPSSLTISGNGNDGIYWSCEGP